MREVPAGSTVVVWFSCGAASAVALKETLERYPQAVVRAVNNPIKEEHHDNRRFLHDVEQWLGIKVELALNPEYPDASCMTVWGQVRYMSGVLGAPCTRLLKKKAREHWELSNHFDYLVLGFTSDESDRSARFQKYERTNLLPVLIDAGITKDDCYRIIQQAGIKLPEMYHLGYPNANCIGCVKATSPTYWNHVRKVHPRVFEERARQSREIGARLVRYKGKRLFLDELPADAKGQKMKSADFECGIFCEGVK